MQYLVYGIIIGTLGLEYVAREFGPSQLAYVQEVVAMLTAAVVVAVGVQQRFRNVAAIYWLLFGGLALVFACGVLVNGVGTGPVFAGIRNYLRAIPLFFLPAVANFSDSQLKRQLTLIAALAVAQFPIALDQRMATFARGYFSGDRTVGTILNSAHLSIFLISVAAVVFAFYIRRRLGLKWLLILLPLILAPTMMNETKGTVVLVPVALFSMLVIGATRNRFRKTVTVLVSFSLFMAVFIPTYDYFMKPRWGYGLIEFMMMEGRVENYLDKDAQVGSYREAGRIDGLTVPIQVLSRDPSQLAFGLGMGSVSDSALGRQFVGEHFQRYGHFVTSLLSQMIWETGLLGALLLVALMLVLYRDAYRVSRGEGLHSDLALGAMGIIAIMALSLPYKRMIDSGALSFLFWYVAGIVAAERARIAESSAEYVPERTKTPTRVADALS